VDGGDPAGEDPPHEPGEPLPETRGLPLFGTENPDG